MLEGTDPNVHLLSGLGDCTEEMAVRNYLLFLDGRAVPVAGCDHPSGGGMFDSLLGDQIRLAFIRHAASWARKHGVPASCFRTLGVAWSTLAVAGFPLPDDVSIQSNSNVIFEQEASSPAMVGHRTTGE